MFLLPLSLSQMIFPPCCILSLVSEDHGIPGWQAEREPRGTRCRFCPSPNSSRPGGSGSAAPSPIGSTASPSPPWACAWSLSQPCHPVLSSLGGCTKQMSVCHLHRQIYIIGQLNSPTIRASQERCPRFPLVSPRTRWIETLLAGHPDLGQAEGTRRRTVVHKCSNSNLRSK